MQGPGQYEVQTDPQTTRTRTKSALANQTASRTEIKQRQQTTVETLGPGAYERNDGIGKSGKGLGFGKPKQEKTVVDNRDYRYESKSVKGLGFGKPKQEKTVVDNRDYRYEGQ